MAQKFQSKVTYEVTLEDNPTWVTDIKVDKDYKRSWKEYFLTEMVAVATTESHVGNEKGILAFGLLDNNVYVSGDDTNDPQGFRIFGYIDYEVHEIAFDYEGPQA
jgi:hypothetical protein